MKERIEEIKDQYKFGVECGHPYFGLSHSDIEWLIQQVERSQSQLNALSFGQKIVAEQQGLIKRYREALEFYADESIYTEMKDQSGVLTVIEDEKGKKST